MGMVRTGGSAKRGGARSAQKRSDAGARRCEAEDRSITKLCGDQRSKASIASLRSWERLRCTNEKAQPKLRFRTACMRPKDFWYVTPTRKSSGIFTRFGVERIAVKGLVLRTLFHSALLALKDTGLLSFSHLLLLISWDVLSEVTHYEHEEHRHEENSQNSS